MIAGRATTCWKAFRGEGTAREFFLVKDTWQVSERPEEGDFLKKLTEATNGLESQKYCSRYYHHETVRVNNQIDDTSDNVRKSGMKFCQRTRFLDESSTSTSSVEPTSTDSSRLSNQNFVVGSCKPQSEHLHIQKRIIQNRVHRRVITRDVGRPLFNATSLKAILTGLIGAIKGLRRSLVENFQ